MFIRWPEAIPLVDAHTMHAFPFNWIARFGVPKELTSDRGSQFTSELWTVCLKYTAFVSTTQLRTNLSLMELWNVNGFSQLPLVLPGVRTMPEEDLAVPQLRLYMKFN